jgi:hypothetical protein
MSDRTEFTVGGAPHAGGIPLEVTGPSQSAGVLPRRVFALLSFLAITALAAAVYRAGGILIPVPWLAVGPLVASLVLLLRDVPAAVAAGRLASRYVSAAAEARVGGDLLEVVSEGGRPRWLIGDTRGKGLPAVRLASVA